MTNDLKNFLEKKYKEQEAQYETSTFINWLKESDKELVNLVLLLVEREVETVDQWSDQVGECISKEDLSTIINNLKEK